MTSRHHQSGFTLIELSIVLVVIGLLVGGILVGDNMIKAASIRSQISQIDKYNAAVNAFRSKFNGLPGDLLPTQASAFGFVTRIGGAGHGDGNGILAGGNANATMACGETVLFWNDLSTAGLADGSFQGADGNYQGIGGNYCTNSNPGGGTLLLKQIIPEAKLGKGNFIIVYGDTYITSGSPPYYGTFSNYYEIVFVPSAWLGTDGGFNAGANRLGMTPRESFAIDSKIDDGLPTTGTVLSRDGMADSRWPPGPGATGAASAGNCGNTDTTPTSYNVGATYGDVYVCTISLKASF